MIYMSLLSPVYAGEVDNYYAWGAYIEDSSSELNHYLNKQVKQSLDKINDKSESECSLVALDIMQDLGSTLYLFGYKGALNADMEIWVQENKNIDKFPRQGSSLDDYVKASIYAPVMRTMGIATDLDVTINVNNVYFGTDKISHLLGSGFEYYRKYLENRKKYSELMSEALSVKWGVEMENGLIGMEVVGIFAYADLEANFQGLMMAKDFCRQENPKIVFSDGIWTLKHDINIRDYVNHNWDESFYSSVYTSYRFKDVKENITKLSLCKKSKKDWLNKHFGGHKIGDFFSTGLSSKLLYLAQMYESDTLEKRVYLEHAHLLKLKLTYEEFQQFHKNINLLNQKDYTLDSICKQIN